MSFLGPDPTIQSRVKEMLDPRLYGKGVKKVQLIQTHTSWVFLAGGFAYKVKKPVNFGFLDYTTLSARRFFCYEELRLNRLISPEIYLDVLPITDEKGRLKIGGKGQVIDYCVMMKALPQSAIMTERLQRGEVSFEDVDEIARTVARFHENAERGREISRYGSSEIIKLNWDENFAQTIGFIGKTITRQAFLEIKRTVERFVASNRDVFQKRRQNGFVRRCHGDLHSKNIFLLDKVYIFDCIEFNPRFSCSDVAAEVAFMAMDLDYHQRHDLSNLFVERYFSYTGDEGCLGLLNFYKCYRAYVRGKVTGFQLDDPGISDKAKAAAKRGARRYFQLALSYARLLEKKPYLLVVFGLPGVGKSFLAQRIAQRTLAMHLLSDSIRKQICGVGFSERRSFEFGRGIYAPEVTERTYDEMFRRAEVFLRAGQSVILDATFLSRERRGRCQDLAKKLKVKPLFVLVECPERVVVQRLKRRADAKGFSDADIEVYRRMKEEFKPPEPNGNLIRVDTSQPIAKALKMIEERLK
ncbi:MAG: AAA family ATPase [candidate division WOR-3 bacterium]